LDLHNPLFWLAIFIHCIAALMKHFRCKHWSGHLYRSRISRHYAYRIPLGKELRKQGARWKIEVDVTSVETSK
jgi:hypothetical protein